MTLSPAAAAPDASALDRTDSPPPPPVPPSPTSTGLQIGNDDIEEDAVAPPGKRSPGKKKAPPAKKAAPATPSTRTSRSATSAGFVDTVAKKNASLQREESPIPTEPDSDALSLRLDLLEDAYNKKFNTILGPAPSSILSLLKATRVDVTRGALVTPVHEGLPVRFDELERRVKILRGRVDSDSSLVASAISTAQAAASGEDIVALQAEITSLNKASQQHLDSLRSLDKRIADSAAIILRLESQDTGKRRREESRSPSPRRRPPSPHRRRPSPSRRRPSPPRRSLTPPPGPSHHGRRGRSLSPPPPQPPPPAYIPCAKLGKVEFKLHTDPGPKRSIYSQVVAVVACHDHAAALQELIKDVRFLMGVPFANIFFRNNKDRDTFISTWGSGRCHGYERVTAVRN